jgi:polar amino acid transport system substrate-binding protein
MATSDEMLTEALSQEGVTPGHQDDIRAYLKILRNRDEKTYEHSVRVGILASKIAIYAAKPGISARMMLWAGFLHDVGKSLVPPGVLTKKEAFTREDYAQMEPHVKYGWDMLSNVHDYTAHVIVRHHQFGPNPYPKELPPLPAHLNGKAEMVNAAARLLALADYYDALMHRDNEKNGRAPLTSKQKREIYMRDNADQKDLVELLESVGVLKF